MKLTATDYMIVEDGEYPATFAAYEPRTTEFGDAILLSFELSDPDNHGTIVSSLASKKMSPKSKLRGWIEGMLGRPLEPAEEVDLDSLLGTKVMLYVSTADTETGTFNPSETSRPMRRTAPVTRAAHQPPHDDESPFDSSVPF